MGSCSSQDGLQEEEFSLALLLFFFRLCLEICVLLEFKTKLCEDGADLPFISPLSHSVLLRAENERHPWSKYFWLFTRVLHI